MGTGTDPSVPDERPRDGAVASRTAAVDEHVASILLGTVRAVEHS